MMERTADDPWSDVSGTIREALEKRLGPRYARQRLGIERDHEAHQVFRFGEPTLHLLIRATLKAARVYERGRRNAERAEVRHNVVVSPLIPASFGGFTILHLSDLHADISPRAMARVGELLPDLDYDLCVLTGDYRGQTFGPFEAALTSVRRLRERIKGQVYGVLGNHDSVLMLPALEGMDIKMLMNEAVAIERGGARIHLAGIDDAHFFRVDNVEKAAATVPRDEFSVLLSHTPENYRQAAHADFDLLLAGHTHGGQLCLPGGFPITLQAKLPRAMGAGSWRYNNMAGYTSTGAGTSIVPVRFNCPPEITLHHLQPSAVKR